MLVHKGGKIKNWGGECRDVTPIKLQSQNIFKESTTGGGGGSGRGRVGNEELIFTKNYFFCENYYLFIYLFIYFFYFFFLGGGGSRGVVELGGIRVDVNEELN